MDLPLISITETASIAKSFPEQGYVGRTQANLEKLQDNHYMIHPSQCIENYGYNVITLNTPTSATTVSATFEGLAGATGYRSLNIEKAGWRCGFAAYLNNGNCIYSEIFSGTSGTATFNCPDNCKKLYFIVSGAPTEHWHHPWMIMMRMMNNGPTK